MSHFAFEIADGIVNAVRSGSAKALLAPALRLQRDVPDQRWSPFLRNHDQPRTRTELGGDPSTGSGQAMAKARLASAILLTMPGMPFVYYGEEIGMSGNKPDERLRTPMQWARSTPARPHGGFTTGTPWEALQPDSQTVTVQAQSGDPQSILELHRRLIHLRSASAALGAGELVPLEASSDQVVAYVRRDGDRAVLAIANLGTKPAYQVTYTSAERVLAPGRYIARNLLGAPDIPTLRLDAEGRLARWAPLRALRPLELYLFELTPRPATP
jgi:glycosidase